MSSLWDVPQYLIMAFSLALDAPAEKASRVSFPPSHALVTSAASRGAVPEETFWLRSVKLAAPKSDILTSYGERIFVTSSGRYYVPAENDRTDILALRRNCDVTARVLAAATAVLREELEQHSGRAPTRAALLIAHVAGKQTALDYIAALDANPGLEAARAVPSLAKLLDGDKALTLAQLDARLSKATRAEPEQVAAARGAGDAGAFKGTLTRPEALSPSLSRFANR